MDAVEYDAELEQLRSKLREYEQQKQELHESQKLLLETQRVAGLGTYVHDFVKGTWTSSSILDKIFGIGADFNRSVEGWGALIHPDLQEYIGEYWATHILRDHKPFDLEYKIVRKSDGAERWVHGLGELNEDEDGNLTTMVGTIQDITQRKESELALVASEIKYRSLTEQITDVLYKTNSKAEITYISPSCRDIFGFDPEEMIGQSFTHFLDTEDITRAVRLYSENMQNKTTIRGLRFRMLQKSGRKFIGELSGAPLIEKGQVIGVIGLIRDVTERENTAQVARKNDTRIRNLLELSQQKHEGPNDILMKGMKRALEQTESPVGFIYALGNERHSGLDLALKRNKDGSYQVTESSTYEPEKLDEAFEKLLKQKFLIENRLPDEVKPILMNGEEYRLSRILIIPVHRDEELVALVTVANRPDQYDETDALQLTLLMDSLWKIRDRWVAEQELRKKTKELDRYFNSSLDLLCIADMEGYFVRLNPEWSRTLGYSLDELIGRKFQDFIHPEDIDATAQATKTLYGGDSISSFTNRYRCKDGSYRSLEWRSFPDNNLIHAVARDMTDHFKLEAQLRQSQKLDALGRLAGGIAHDFNNMLGVILGMVELVLNDTPEDDLHFGDLQQIRHAAERSASLTRQLLTFSRTQVAELKRLEINSTIHEQLKILKRLIGEDIAIHVEADDQDLPIRIDPSQFDQILVNLSANARDAIEGNGEILISTKRVTSEQIPSTAEFNPQKMEYACITFSDTGEGIDQKDIEKIFDPFFTTKADSRGTGLGLATVYGVVAQNGGTIQVSSAPGSGTTFAIYLPLSRKKVSKREEGSRTSSGGKETILVVEDEQQILTIIDRILRSQGYQVYTAEHPTHALNLIEQDAFEVDLLLTDMVLPQMNGQELSKRIRQKYPEVRTLYMSGYTASVFDAQANEDEQFALIPKPFKKAELVAKIREILDVA